MDVFHYGLKAPDHPIMVPTRHLHMGVLTETELPGTVMMMNVSTKLDNEDDERSRQIGQ